MPDPDPTVPPVPKKRGCFFYGCLVSAVLLVLAILGIFLAGHYFIGRLNGIIAQYTDTAPATLPKSDMPADQLKALNARAQAFHDAVEANSNTPPLILTGPEVNALLGTLPELQSYKDKFYVTFNGDKAEAQISLPLESLPAPFSALNVKGRYLNGKGTFKVTLMQGLLYVNADTLEVKGQPLPANFLASFKQQNLAQGFDQSTNAASLQKYDSIQVTNSTLVVTPLAH
jgi:hypothetical protein